jgi:hypothetical protein
MEKMKKPENHTICRLLIRDESHFVGAAGFEPTTLWSQTRCATGLRYAPLPFLKRLQK